MDPHHCCSGSEFRKTYYMFSCQHMLLSEQSDSRSRLVCRQTKGKFAWSLSTAPLPHLLHSEEMPYFSAAASHLHHFQPQRQYIMSDRPGENGPTKLLPVNSLAKLLLKFNSAAVGKDIGLSLQEDVSLRQCLLTTRLHSAKIVQDCNHELTEPKKHLLYELCMQETIAVTIYS